MTVSEVSFSPVSVVNMDSASCAVPFNSDLTGALVLAAKEATDCRFAASVRTIYEIDGIAIRDINAITRENIIVLY